MSHFLVFLTFHEGYLYLSSHFMSHFHVFSHISWKIISYLYFPYQIELFCSSLNKKESHFCILIKMGFLFRYFCIYLFIYFYISSFLCCFILYCCNFNYISIFYIAAIIGASISGHLRYLKLRFVIISCHWYWF